MPALLIVAAPLTRAQIIDEFGELDRRMAEFAPLSRRYKALQDQIRGWYEIHPAGAPATASGALYDVQIHPRSNERFFSLKAKARIFTKLGNTRTIVLFSVTLKTVEEAFTKEKFDALVSSAPTRPRTPVAVFKATAKATYKP